VARVRAGTDQIDVEGATLGDVLRAAAAACPGLVPDVILNGALTTHWRASLNGREFLASPEAPVSPGDAVIILSALAGG